MRRAVIRIQRDDSAKAAVAAMGRNFVRAWKSGKSGDPAATFIFSSPAQLFSVLSPKRWQLTEHLQKAGPMSVRGLARALERDVKRVHTDVTLLAGWGIVERTGGGKVHVPFDVIHADFDLRAAA